MSEVPFKKVICTYQEKEYEIDVHKTDRGYEVLALSNGQPANDRRYFCDFQTDAEYKNKFGQHGWQRLIRCAKADIAGVSIYRVNK